VGQPGCGTTDPFSHATPSGAPSNAVEPTVNIGLPTTILKQQALLSLGIPNLLFATPTPFVTNTPSIKFPIPNQHPGRRKNSAKTQSNDSPFQAMVKNVVKLSALFWEII